jgi:CRISPR-associated protein Cmr6
MDSAIPAYFDRSLISQAPPGHRFRLYFQGWDPKRDWKPAWEKDEKDRKQKTKEDKKGDEKRQAVESATALGEHEWRKRQLGQALQLETQVHIFSAKSRAPFVTGMGLEHPLENGFAFLDPYGLPYLPGSGVKGVVRRAAEELALFDSASSGWTMDAVWWLFGFDERSAFFPNDSKTEAESVRKEQERWKGAYRAWAAQPAAESVSAFIRTALPEELSKPWLENPQGFLARLLEDQALRRSLHLRGSLCFWDVLPHARLRVDLMNPHYSHYYQEKDGQRQWPGDWGNPNPIVFLSLPEGTEFRFIVEFRPIAALPQEMKAQWQKLIQGALEHAGKWLGFGGKTSQGYGLLEPNQADKKFIQKEIQRELQRRQEAERRRLEEQKRRELESLSPLERLIRELEQANENRVHDVYRMLDQYTGDEQRRLALALKQAYQKYDKWSGKLSDKQRPKVQRLKQILGEPS